MVYVLILAAGLLLAALNTWQRLGRSSRARSWSRGLRKEETSRNVLVLWPLIALALVAGGLAGLLGDSAGAIVAPLLFLATAILWLAYAVLPIPVPRIVQPRWYRQGQPREASRR